MRRRRQFWEFWDFVQMPVRDVDALPEGASRCTQLFDEVWVSSAVRAGGRRPLHPRRCVASRMYIVSYETTGSVLAWCAFVARLLCAYVCER